MGPTRMNFAQKDGKVLKHQMLGGHIFRSMEVPEHVSAKTLLFLRSITRPFGSYNIIPSLDCRHSSRTSPPEPKNRDLRLYYLARMDVW